MFFRIFVSAVIALVASVCNLSNAQSLSDANIVGHVIDSSTGEHLPFHTIALRGTSIGAVSDASGHFALRNIPPGDYVIEASAIGYTTKSRKVNVVKGKTIEVNFEVDPDAMLLDQVVVTGSKSEQKRRESSSLVNVVTAKLFENVSACSLADGLNFQPGVRVENDCQNCGFTQVRVNGLDGHYSQILMNSRPVFSALTGVYGLEQIPANMIDRVEVMRGGGSALFGSSAIGGTINIITKDPVVNYAEVSHRLMSVGCSGALDNNTTLNASVVGNNGRLGLTVYGQSRHRDGYDHDGDGFTEIATLSSRTLGTRAFMRPSANSRLTAEWHTTHEYRRGGDALELPPHMALVAEEVDHNINAGEVSYDLWNSSRSNRLGVFVALQNTRRKSYYGSDMDPNAYGRTHDLVTTAGAQWTHSFSRLLFMPSELIAGLEYNYNYLRDITVGYDHDVTQRVHIYSAYLQNEWRTSRWGFLIGARVDRHSLIHNPIISPRANIRFNPSDNLNFRLSYSTGFRSPQAYDEDFHVAVVGGDRLVTVLAHDLKQESSNSFSASADLYRRLGSVQANLLIEGFYTDLRDVFALRQLPDPDDAGNAVLERYNGSGARVAGLNVETRFVFSSRTQLQAGATFQRSRYKKPEQWSDNPDVAPVKRMFRTPDAYGYFTFSHKFTRALGSSVSGTWSGPMLVQHLEGSGTPVDVAETTPSFFDLGLKLSYEFKILSDSCLEFDAGISNIFNSYQKTFDKGHLRDSGYIYGPGLPRSVYVSAKVHI